MRPIKIHSFCNGRQLCNSSPTGRIGNPVTCKKCLKVLSRINDPQTRSQAFLSILEGEVIRIGFAEVSALTGIQNLHRTFSKNASPKLETLFRIADAAGMELILDLKEKE